MLFKRHQLRNIKEVEEQKPVKIYRFIIYQPTFFMSEGSVF